MGSSTVAINKNSSFKPHIDSGAGAGQGLSLIVGLGNYVGGETVVEGVEHNIRYAPMEFDGWKQRHWTKPFRGESTYPFIEALSTTASITSYIFAIGLILFSVSTFSSRVVNI
eukprot:Awhi_evm1s13245